MGNHFTNWNTGCNCDNACADEVVSVAAACDTGCACNAANTASTCGCAAANAASAGCACENAGRRCRKTNQPCACSAGEGTHVYFEACDGCKEIAVTSACQQELAMGRTLDVNVTLSNVCPGRRSALGLTLTEMDENGMEHARGFQAVTVPAHNGRCNQDVQVETVRFILPEDHQCMQQRRHFIVRTQHHYLDAGGMWNNNWNR